MKTKFRGGIVWRGPPKSSSKKDGAEPTPIPIKIVADAPSPVEMDSSPPKTNRTDDFYLSWDKFLAKQPKRATKSSRSAKKIVEAKAAVADSPGDGLQKEENAAKSYQQAAEECRNRVAAIVKECKRLNQKYQDLSFDLDNDMDCMLSLDGQAPDAVKDIDFPPWVKRIEDIFEKPQFFIDGASAEDVHQGEDGDCWFLAALMALCAKKELVDKLCVARDEKVGVYGFVFFRDGEWIPEVIDDKLYLRVGDDDKLAILRDQGPDTRPTRIYYEDEKLKLLLQKGGEALYFSHCKSNETWLPLIEKAYAKAHGDYRAIEGGWASEGIEDLTGGVAVNLNPEDIMDKDRFWTEQLMQVNKKYLFGGSSQEAFRKGIYETHAYVVLEAWEEGDLRLVKIRNPWGEREWTGDWSDGDKLWTAEMMTKLKHTFGDDGVFWMTYKDFLKHFRAISRTRLFDETWKVGTCWTSVNVPWTPDFLDTKFQFTLSKPGPVVLVLSQPDDRYYRGLTGRFLYSLHFRLHGQQSAADEDLDPEAGWIVRSMHASGSDPRNTRSVSAEVEDLPAGTYTVLVKITAQRYDADSTFAESISECAQKRKEKLLSVGRRFDIAQSKGDRRSAERTARQVKASDLFAKRLLLMRRQRKAERDARARHKLREERRKKLEEERDRKFKYEQWLQAKRVEKREKAKFKKEQAKALAAEAAAAAAAAAAAEAVVDAVKKEAEVGVKNVAGEAEAAKDGKEDVAGAAVEVTDEKKGEEVPVVSPVDAQAPADAAASSEKTPISPIAPTSEATQAKEEPTTKSDPAAATEALSKLSLEPITTAATTEATAAAVAAEAATETVVSAQVESSPSQEKAEDKAGENLETGTKTEPEAKADEKKSPTQPVPDKAEEVSTDDDEFIYEPSVAAPSELDDDDFPWDADIDGPVPPPYYRPTPSSIGNIDAPSGSVEDAESLDVDMDALAILDEGDGGSDEESDDDDDDEEDAIFGTDPWNAICVVGLRVYHSAEEQGVEVKVVREE